jgi:tetratricopeptide (TPR) repeat protein
VGFSRLTLFLAAQFLWLPSCGLFVGEPSLPSLAEVAEARAEQSEDWQLLESAWLEVSENSFDPLQTVAALRLDHPDSVRLAIYEQDLQLEHLGMAQTRSLSWSTYTQTPTALNAYLWARVAEDPVRRDALLVEALELDDELVDARVLQIANAAFAGDTEVLNDLLELIGDHPGSASAWRLLGTLAPLFDRRDLAYRAADTEPWSPFDSDERATFAQARRALQDGSLEVALLRSHELPPGTSQTVNLQVAIFTAMGKADVGLQVLDEYLVENPDDLVAVFNRALLLREYLNRSEEAIAELERFLALDEEFGGADLMRRMQAEFWLGRGPQS